MNKTLIELHRELVAADLKYNEILSEIVKQYEVGQLIQYRNNPIAKVLMTARIKELMPWGLVVERYRPDGARMRGTGYITGTNLLSVIKIDEIVP